MAASRFDFVNAVVANRDLVVTSSHAHGCRLEPRESDLAWHCDLDDGWTTADDKDPAASVRWVCPGLRDRGPGVKSALPDIEVSRSGPQSDLATLLKGLLGRPRRGPGGGGAPRYAYTDPDGLLDVDLRRRIESWPLAVDDAGLELPAELTSIRRSREGLIVSSTSWWGSAAALDHQIGLALDIAARLRARA